MASPKQLVVASLNVAVETCSAALESISDAPHDSDGPDLAVLHKDFTSILTLLYASTTKLCLALKPISPTYSASLSPLKDISDQVSALSHCVCLLEHKHGITLIQEITSIAKEVIQSIRSLVQAFLDIEKSGQRAASGKAGDEYMVRVGAVHEIIRNARSLSEDNLAAVKKKLAQDHSSLKDGVEEVDEMIKAHESGAEVDVEDDSDGWDELGVEKKQMDGEELERAKKTYAILRLSTLLHNHIIKDILSPPNLKFSPHLIQNLDSLPPQSSTLLIASDDLISTIYAPQNPSDISTELASFTKLIGALQSIILALSQKPTLSEQLQAMSLGGTTQKDPKKWFEMCFLQIQKAAENLKSTLSIRH
ncbi:hypothetical protein H0H81_008119 [Sphagnurus paluster]|uniref:Cyclin-D1-binding protein 1 n=1 Tax=Sphagnurus paluster TaxID=117069 RepID=A0A9P7KIF5_9AGAR|nr:hypothetical protein H0H81_008119 [Sphagnurus paluster]